MNIEKKQYKRLKQRGRRTDLGPYGNAGGLGIGRELAVSQSGFADAGRIFACKNQKHTIKSGGGERW